MPGARTCDGCGQEVPAGRAVCPTCGRAQLGGGGPGRPAAAGDDDRPRPPGAARWVVSGEATRSPATVVPGAVPLPPRRRPRNRRLRRLTAVLVLLLLVVGAGVGLSLLDDGDDGPAGDAAPTSAPSGPAATAAPTTPPQNPFPVADACPDHLTTDALPALPAQPPRVEDGPGQHALLVDVGGFRSSRRAEVVGNLDTAPGGGFQLGHTDASDAKTVMVACAYQGEATPTDVTCSFGDPRVPAAAYEVRLARTRVDIVVYELRTGTALGTAEVLGPEPTECPERATDYLDGVLEVDPDPQQYVDWARAHLVGARLG